MLLEAGCSLRAANQDKIAFYRRNLAALLDALDRQLPGTGRANARHLAGTAPAGGFFVVVDVPVARDVKLLEIVRAGVRRAVDPDARSSTATAAARTRSGCPAARWTPADIDEGVRRLAQLVRHRL